jgi:hypothetical protein
MPTRQSVHRPPWSTPALAAKREAERKQRLDQARPPSSQRGYDAEWRALRARFLEHNPWCCVDGCMRRATDVDHIRSIRERPDLRLEWSNMRQMCHRHHSRVTALTQGFARRR